MIDRWSEPPGLDPDPGEMMRVVVESGEWVGPDAIVEFRDPARPGRTYQVVVIAGQCPGGIRIGDLALIRWRAAQRTDRLRGFSGWELVERIEVGPVIREHEPQRCA